MCDCIPRTFLWFAQLGPVLTTLKGQTRGEASPADPLRHTLFDSYSKVCIIDRTQIPAGTSTQDLSICTNVGPQNKVTVLYRTGRKEKKMLWRRIEGMGGIVNVTRTKFKRIEFGATTPPPPPPPPPPPQPPPSPAHPPTPLLPVTLLALSPELFTELSSCCWCF